MNFKSDLPGQSAMNVSIETTMPHTLPPLLKRMRLTTREQEVLLYMSRGETSDEIGKRLYIGKLTVDSHRKNIIRKLGVPNVTAAVAYALRNNIIS